MRTLLLASLLLCRAALAASTAWTTAGSAPPGKRENTALMYSNGTVYATAGYDGANLLNDSWQAPLPPSGVLGTFTQNAALPGLRAGHSMAWLGNHVYLTGGGDNTVFTALEGTTSLGSWTQLTGAPQGRTQGAAFGAAGSIFVLGGVANDGVNYLGDVQRGQVAVDYTISGWTQVGAFKASLGGRSLFGFATLPGPSGSTRLWVMGGYDGSLMSEVLYASVDSTGTLSSFATTTSLPSARYAACAFADGEFVYLAGGADATGYLSDVIAARVQPDGSLGAWLPQPALPDARAFCAATSGSHTAVILGGIGPQGASQSVVRSDVLTSTLSSPGSAASLAYLGPSLYSSTVGVCAGPFTLEVRDANGLPTQAEQKYTVVVAQQTGTSAGAFYVDAGCASPTNAVVVQVGATRGSVYFKSTLAGRYTFDYGDATLGDGSFQAEFTNGATDGGTSDGGTADGGGAATDPHSVNGWGCSSAPLGPAALVGALAWLLLGRRRAAARARGDCC